MNKDIMKAAGFGDHVKRVERGECPICGKRINMHDFKNDISKREFKISGMCQPCQDQLFAKPDLT